MFQVLEHNYWRMKNRTCLAAGSRPAESETSDQSGSRTVSENLLLIPKTSGKYPEETDMDLMGGSGPVPEPPISYWSSEHQENVKGCEYVLAVSTSSTETIQFMLKHFTKLMQKTTVPPFCGLKYYSLSSSIFSQWCCWYGQRVPS